jgi:hypothetical protein
LPADNVVIEELAKELEASYGFEEALICHF